METENRTGQDAASDSQADGFSPRVEETPLFEAEFDADSTPWWITITHR